MPNNTIIKEYNKARLFYYGNAMARRIIKKNICEPNYHKPVLLPDEGNEFIKQLIKSNKSFMAARYGGTEAKTIADVLYSKANGKLGGVNDRTINRLSALSGFFPQNKELLYKFSDLYLKCAESVDVLAVWNIFMQKYFATEYNYEATLTTLESLEPYYFKKPWSEELKGKKVLVVHPFKNTILSQYKKREKLFENKNILPEFDLKVVKSVQTLANQEDERFKDWFEALDYMFDEIKKCDFEIALIGCGAYGLPLAAKIKALGKQAIHMGGALQLLFGIKGNRWDNDLIIKKLYNEAWVRPSLEDAIKNKDKIEGACYW